MAKIRRSALPHSIDDGKKVVLRPGVVLFGESLDDLVVKEVDSILQRADLFFVVGTSSAVYPAAGYAERAFR